MTSWEKPFNTGMGRVGKILGVRIFLDQGRVDFFSDPEGGKDFFHASMANLF